MAGRRLWYLGALTASVLFYIAYGQWLSWIVLLTVAALPWFSLLLSLPAMTRFRAFPGGTRETEQGGEAELYLAGTCPVPMPPFRGRLKLTRCSTGESLYYEDSRDLQTHHCGGWTVSAEGLRVSDYLGLFSFPVRSREKTRLLIRPKPLAMELSRDPDRIVPRAWKPKNSGGWTENRELRLYRPGDSLNRIHWKLSAKTGSLMFRQAMEPLQGLVLVTFRLQGSPAELDRKFGRLVWLGRYLLDREIRFELRALTADGLLTFPIGTEVELWHAVDDLLCRREAPRDAAFLHGCGALWHCHIGGQPDEA